MELNARQELEVYKKALELACDEIMWRECKAFNYTSYDCKDYCVSYEACHKEVTWEQHFVQRAQWTLMAEGDI